MWRRKFAMLLLVFVSVFQIPSALAQLNLNEISGYSYQVRNWLPEKGSPVSVYSIAQTPDGYLWLANEFGLFRFDGIHFLNMNRLSLKLFKYQECNALYISHDSTLFAGFRQGLILTYKNKQWSILDSEKVFLYKSIDCIAEDRYHNIWAGLAGNGVICYSRKASRIYTTANGLCDDDVKVICPGIHGEVWIGTDKGLCAIGKEGIKNYGSKEGLMHQNINALYIDSTNTLWIGSDDGYLLYMKEGKIRPWEDQQGKTKHSIKQITGFGKNTLAIATEGQGVFLLNTLTRKTELIDTKNKLSSNIILSLFRDIDDNLWAGTRVSGISRIRNSPMQMINIGKGLSGALISSIIQSDDGSVYVGNTEGSLERIRNNKVENLGPKLGIGRSPVLSIAIDKGHNIWVGSRNVLVKFNGTTSQKLSQKQGLIAGEFHALYFSREGYLWVGTNQGIYIIKDDKVVSVLTSKEGLPSNRIFCLLEDRKGFMWAGTQDGGLARIKDGNIKAYGKSQGLIDNEILCLHLDSLNKIWIGTAYNGIVHLDPETETFTPIESDKLYLELSKTIAFLFEDRTGNMWIAGFSGLAGVKFAVLQKLIQNKEVPVYLRSVAFDPAIGFTGFQMGLFPGAWKMKNGQIWYPVPGGIAVINPDNSMTWSSNPVPLIDSVIINNKAAITSDVYEIPAGMAHLEIHYTAPSFTLPEDLTFMYRLAGFDHAWDTVGHRRVAYYTNIPPGDYTFEVRVFNNLCELSPATASLRIHVLPYFYQTWWFIAVCILVGLLLVWMIFKYRIRYIREKELEALVIERTEQIRKLNEQLEQKVRDRTAELETTNKELEAFSYSVSHDLKAPVRRIDHITKAYIEDYFAKLDTNELDLLKKITEAAGSMNILIDELLKLSRIVRQDIDKMQVNLSDMATEINNEIRKVSPKRNVRLMIQEGLLEYCDPKLMRIVLQNLFDNAWKYSSKVKEAVIEFDRTVKDGKSVYFVKDNGAGFDMTYYDKLFTPFQRLHTEDEFTGSGIGLATVKRVILKHGGKIWAESAVGEGSVFYFTLDHDISKH